MLNTVKVTQPITAAPAHMGAANPTGTVLPGGSVLTISAYSDAVIRVWNIGSSVRPLTKDDTFTDVTSAEVEEFGPFPGPRNFKFSVVTGDKGQYVISRDE